MFNWLREIYPFRTINIKQKEPSPFIDKQLEHTVYLNALSEAVVNNIKQHIESINLVKILGVTPSVDIMSNTHEVDTTRYSVCGLEDELFSINTCKSRNEKFSRFLLREDRYSYNSRSYELAFTDSSDEYKQHNISIDMARLDGVLTAIKLNINLKLLRRIEKLVIPQVKKAISEDVKYSNISQTYEFTDNGAIKVNKRLNTEYEMAVGISSTLCHDIRHNDHESVDSLVNHIVTLLKGMLDKAMEEYSNQEILLEANGGVVVKMYNTDKHVQLGVPDRILYTHKDVCPAINQSYLTYKCPWTAEVVTVDISGYSTIRMNGADQLFPAPVKALMS